MLIKQIIGVINLSVPLILLFGIYPSLITNIFVQISCCLFLGAYIYFTGKKQMNQANNVLLYTPSGDKLTLFQSLIKECGVNLGKVKIKYAYIAEGLAMARGDVIIVDPIMFNFFDEDTPAIRVKDIFHEHVERTLAPVQKERLNNLNAIVNPAVFRFIFKHELGHVAANYSTKKLLVNAAIIFCSTYLGIQAALYILQFNGFAAIFAGMFVGGVSDLFLSYASNASFKYCEEINADTFAIKYSSLEDVKEAAVFFEKHQEIIDMHKEPGNFLTKIPSVVLSGHLNGKT